MTSPVRLTDEELLQKFSINWSTGCWEWTGAKNRAGYGLVRVDGPKGTRPRTPAPRWFFAQMVGRSLRKTEYVCHRCDNPGCVNPAHLFLSDSLGNMRDKVAKDRHIYGDRHPLAKLNWAAVAEIREKHRNGGYSLRALARAYGVSKRAILTVVQRKSWITHEERRANGRAGS